MEFRLLLFRSPTRSPGAEMRITARSLSSSRVAYSLPFMVRVRPLASLASSCTSLTVSVLGILARMQAITDAAVCGGLFADGASACAAVTATASVSPDRQARILFMWRSPSRREERRGGKEWVRTGELWLSSYS